MEPLTTDRQPSAVAAACAAGLGLVMLDNTSVAVALPAVQRDLGIEVAGLQWVSAMLALATAAALPLSGAAGQRWGARATARAGVLVFALATICALAAPGLAALLSARALAGVGVAFMLPNSAALLAANVPPSARGRTVGLWITIGSLGLVVGPLAGGWLVSTLGWRGVFVLPLPVALAGAAGLGTLRDAARGPVRRLDLAGMLTSSAALFCLSFALVESGRADRRLPLLAGLLVTGTGMILLFVGVERRAQAPVLDFELLRDGRFPAVLGASLLFNAAVTGGFFLASLLLQSARGVRPGPASVVLLAAAAAMPLGGRLTGRALPRWGLRILLAGASGLACAGYLLAAALGAAPLGLLAGALALSGLAAGFFFAGDTLAVLEVVHEERSSSGLAMLSLARQTGSVAGVAALGAVSELARSAGADQLTGLRVGLFAAAVAVLAAMLLVLRFLRVPTAVAARRATNSSA